MSKARGNRPGKSSHARQAALAGFALLFLCLTALGLRADDAEPLQKIFTNFPVLNLLTNEFGEPAFQTIPLTNAVKAGDYSYYGFRFQVPKRAHHEDLVWSFAMPGPRFFWYIVPESGEMNGFTEYNTRSRSDYLGPDRLFPINGKSLCVQHLPGDWLNDGDTYLIWFRFTDKHPAKLSLTFTFAHTDAGEPKLLKSMLKALALDRRSSHPVVNPKNHHCYILVRQATWKASEKMAVALGGHLATVRNKDEEEWIYKTFADRGGCKRILWIGLNDTAKKFHFGWSSGESVSYTCWAPGEPNNAGRGEDFVGIFYPNHKEGGKWNDWDDRVKDPIGIPMNGVVEIIPKEPANVASLAGGNATLNRGDSGAAPGDKELPASASAKLTAVDIRPSLVISSDGAAIRLQWPVSLVDHMLEVTTNLNEPFTMFGYSEMTNLEAGIVYATITNPVPQMFFRLRRP